MSNKSRAQKKPVKKAKFEPVRITTTDVEVEEATRVPLFYIDDEEYTIPQTFSASIGLRYLRNINVDGRDYAIAQLMEEVLGEEGFEALSTCNYLTKTQIENITEYIVELALGAVDEGN